MQAWSKDFILYRRRMVEHRSNSVLMKLLVGREPSVVDDVWPTFISEQCHQQCHRHSGSQPSVDAPFQSLYHSYWTHCQLTVISIPTCFPSTPKYISFSTIISWFYTVTLLRLCGLRNSSAILATLKKFDWRWNWPCVCLSLSVCLSV